MKAWTDATLSIFLRRAESGWVISRYTKDSRHDGDLIAGLSDDRALLEFVAKQLALPAPTLPSIDAVSLETVQASLARHREIIMASLPAAVASELLGLSPNPRAEEAPAAAMVPPPVSAGLVAALGPFARLARVMRDMGGVELVTYKYNDDLQLDAEIELHHVHDLLIAAGLFTDEMRPSQSQAADASVKPAEGATSPPATALDQGDSDGDDGE